LNIDLSQSTVSGISAGGAMPVQLAVSHSSLFKGVGIFAGIGYDCAQGSLETAEMTCMYCMPAPSASHQINTANLRSALGLIDGVGNISHSNLYLFTGEDDNTVKKPSVDAIYEFYSYFYRQAGRDTSSILYETSIAADILSQLIFLPTLFPVQLLPALTLLIVSMTGLESCYNTCLTTHSLILPLQRKER
jgi:hypothetical protein